MGKFLLVSLMVVGSQSFAANDKLSLADSKEVAKQEKFVTEAQATITKACGCAPTYTMEWAKLKKVNDNEFYIKGNGAGCYNGFAEVAEEICKGGAKAQFCKGVKKVIVTATNGSDYSNALKSGTLTMISSSTGCAGTSDLQKTIETAL